MVRGGRLLLGGECGRGYRFCGGGQGSHTECGKEKMLKSQRQGLEGQGKAGDECVEFVSRGVQAASAFTAPFLLEGRDAAADPTGRCGEADGIEGERAAGQERVHFGDG